MTKPKPHVPTEGDVYVRQLPDGRWAAVRLLKVSGRSKIVCTTTWLADQPPLPGELSLHEPVIQNRFAFRNKPDVIWLDGAPPAAFGFAFNLPLKPEERDAECRSYGGSWSERHGLSAWHEWRWNHDRPAFEAEIAAVRAAEEERRRQALLVQRPKRMLAESRFWAMIDLLDWDQAGDDDAVLAPLVDELAAVTKADIRGFEERLAHCLHQLDTQAHARHIGSDSWTGDARHFSVDGFLYARCCAVANGRSFYDKAFADPTCMPKDLEFEALLHVAGQAWERKTGDEFDHDTGCSVETFSNLAGWAEPD